MERRDVFSVKYLQEAKHTRTSVRTSNTYAQVEILDFYSSSPRYLGRQMRDLAREFGFKSSSIT
jgi:hypothetical protein